MFSCRPVSEPPKIRLADGRTWSLLRKDAVTWWTEPGARAAITEAMADPFGRQHLFNLADAMFCGATDEPRVCRSNGLFTMSLI